MPSPPFHFHNGHQGDNVGLDEGPHGGQGAGEDRNLENNQAPNEGQWELWPGAAPTAHLALPARPVMADGNDPIANTQNNWALVLHQPAQDHLEWPQLLAPAQQIQSMEQQANLRDDQLSLSLSLSGGFLRGLNL